jgi:hypothetical protein
MLGDRYVLLGLARPRCTWFSAVAQWATSAALPAEFTKCVSAEELRAHLRSGKVHSAVLLDGGLPATDRDLLAAARDAGCPVLIVDDGRAGRDWMGLGASGVLPADLSRETLLDVLAHAAVMIPRSDISAAGLAEAAPVAAPWEGRLAAVCGPGGTGSSTVAAALAQGLSNDQRLRDRIVLADLCLHAEQAMLHDAGEVFPGLQELVEAHRGGEAGPGEVRQLTHRVPERGYHLLLGLRAARHWVLMRPKAFEAALAALRRTYETVVCDVDADFESEDDAGSADVAERCMLARTPVQQADVVFAVGVAGMKGLHSLVRVLGDLVRAGVAASRIQPVINVAPRHPQGRAELAAALAELSAGSVGRELAAPVFLPRRKVGQAMRDGARLPNPLPQTLAGAWHAGLERAGVSVRTPPGPSG